MQIHDANSFRNALPVNKSVISGNRHSNQSISFPNTLLFVSLLGHFNGFCMRSLYSWPTFPPNLEAPIARSLSIQFILQALIDGFTTIENLQKASPIQGINLREEIKTFSVHLQKTFFFSFEK